MGFTQEILEDLRTGFGETDGERDPGHLLSTYPLTAAISRVMNNLKGVPPPLIRKKHYTTFERSR